MEILDLNTSHLPSSRVHPHLPQLPKISHPVSLHRKIPGRNHTRVFQSDYPFAHPETQKRVDPKAGQPGVTEGWTDTLALARQE